MSNIISDIIEDVDVKVKPNKTKFYIKWIVRITISLIIFAFAIGQIKVKFLNRIDVIENGQAENEKTITELKKQVSDGFTNVNLRIDKIYDDGYVAFIDYQRFNNKQLELIIDYGTKNKELLKKMLEINSIEREKIVGSSIEQAKKNLQSYKNFVGIFRYNELSTQINVNGIDTIFSILGATQEYINEIKNKNYNVGEVKNSNKYPGLYDFKYQNKNRYENTSPKVH
jgi:hypothetical protein